MSPFAELSPPYSTIVADPPWTYQQSPKGAVDYSTMTDAEIAALPVETLAADNAHLYLWVTTPRLWESPNPAEIAQAWGFTYKTLVTWVKGNRNGVGFYYRGDAEHCLFCVRGSAPIPGEIRESNVLWSPRTHHSAKPGAFMDRVEKVSPGPYLELFCREPRFGWDSWGYGYESAVSL